MLILVICKYSKDLKKIAEDTWWKCSFQMLKAANSIVSDEIWPKFKLINTLIYVLVTYKDEENQMKNEGTRVVTTLYSYIFDAPGQLAL